ncbi:MAG: hypothetical protein Q9173_006105 [Seirophora scorigena]
MPFLAWNRIFHITLLCLLLIIYLLHSYPAPTNSPEDETNTNTEHTRPPPAEPPASPALESRSRMQAVWKAVVELGDGVARIEEEERVSYAQSVLEGNVSRIAREVARVRREGEVGLMQ